SRRRHTRSKRDWSSDVCSSDLTAACGFAQSAVQLAVFRILLGLGQGGEWATGAALVSESFPARHRGKALAFVQSSWAIGYGLAALTNLLVMPIWGWRGVFFVGVLPATQGGIGLSSSAMSWFVMAMQVGMWFGYVSFGFIADAIGRKHTYVIFVLVAAILLPLYGILRQPVVLLALGPFVAFFGTGY